MQYQSATKGILPHKMSAAGDFLRYQNAPKGILPYTMSAAGGFFCDIRAVLTTEEISPYKMSAAGENFCIGVVRFCESTVLPPCKGGGGPRGDFFSLGVSRGGSISGMENSGTPPLTGGEYLGYSPPQGGDLGGTVFGESPPSRNCLSISLI